jgi:SpoIID/LytB domain protein
VAFAVIALGIAGSVVSSTASAPSAAADTVVTLAGHGWGHGRGMGQWGAQGYAKDLGWNAGQILDHFYGGTSTGSIDDNSVIGVRLMAQEGRDLVVTSGAPFDVPGIGPVDAGRGVRVHWTGTSFELSVAVTACNGDEVPNYHPTYPGGGSITSTVADPGNDINLMLTVCNEDGFGNNISYRGALRALVDAAVVRSVNDVTYGQYLRGSVPRESPSSWTAAALQAQAVTARSYTAASKRYSYAQICDTTACQVYGGAGISGLYREAASTDNAIAATSGQVRVKSGVIQTTEYSSSTGGYTSGGSFPAVPDDGDATAGNINHAWTTTTLTGSAIAARYGIGTFQGFVFSSRNGFGDMGGRVLSMQIVGTSATVTRSGTGFQSDWGLKSDWFTAVNSPNLLTWYLRNSDSGGQADITPFAYGTRGDIPVVGDWNNGPLDGIGVFRDGTWSLRNTPSAGPANLSFSYGTIGYQPVVGRWSPGVTGIGVFVNGNWYLRNSPSPGAPNASFAYGSPGDIPVVGDWDNNGIDTIGIFQNGTWYLRNSNTPGPPDIVVSYGAAGYTPLVGVWQGNGGAQSLGVFTAGNWYLRNVVSSSQLITPGPATIVFSFGTAGYTPVRGNWNGGSIHGVGVVVSS